MPHFYHVPICYHKTGRGDPSPVPTLSDTPHLRCTISFYYLKIDLQAQEKMNLEGFQQELNYNITCYKEK